MDAEIGQEASIRSTPLSRAEVTHIEFIEQFFFAYRDFTADPDRILDRLGFGRAHHRALYFVSRRPGMTVAELLEILAITKQSLSRVLRQLVGAGYIHQQEGYSDRRQRLLYPTGAGHELILELSGPQSRRIANALEICGIEHTNAISAFLQAMIDRSHSGR
jgi:DNA-binding MarR family transcriptional regulator